MILPYFNNVFGLRCVVLREIDFLLKNCWLLQLRRLCGNQLLEYRYAQVWIIEKWRKQSKIWLILWKPANLELNFDCATFQNCFFEVIALFGSKWLTLCFLVNFVWQWTTSQSLHKLSVQSRHLATARLFSTSQLSHGGRAILQSIGLIWRNWLIATTILSCVCKMSSST